MRSEFLSFSCSSSSSTSKLIMVGFTLFISILFVQYYFELPCSNGNGRNPSHLLHPLSHYCLIFLSTATTTTINKSSIRNYVSGKISDPSPAMNLGNLEKDIINVSSRWYPSAGYNFLAPPPPPPYVQDNNSSSRNYYNMTMNKNYNITSQISPPLPEDCKLMLEKGTPETLTAAKKGDSASAAADAVVSIATMNNILLQSYSSPAAVSNSACISGIDQELLEARLQIEKAPVFPSNSSEGLYAPIYWNISRFKRSYELMEKTLKVYIYREGNRPVFHQPNLRGIYASEGWFMKQMESNKQYLTNNPTKAHLFYFPFSSQLLEQIVYVPNSHSFDRLKKYLANYLDIIKTKYPFWNRTSGADHFLVACHDWAPEETRRLMANCIRALCNADIKEGFELGKDVSLPETLMPPAKELQVLLLNGRYNKNPPSSHRKFLAFFAGNMHGYLRPILLKNWGNNMNKDQEMKIFGRMHKTNYVNHMKNSKYCICARGYEVNSPRLVESIMYDCVPVIISDNFVPPFLEVLNWEKIAVFIPEKEIPNLKNILLSISERRYRVMHQRVKMVRRHFVWHPSMPEKYDIFHMILHSIWYNRVFRTTQH